MDHHSDRHCAELGTCPYFCPVHHTHHPVITMVEYCQEKDDRRRAG